MKKIVSLLLVGLLSVALCASAFAATSQSVVSGTTTSLDSKDWAVYPINDKDKTDIVLKVYTAQSTKTVTTDTKTTVSYIPAFYLAEGTGLNSDEVLVECTEACADYRIFKNNTFVCFANKDYIPVEFCENATFVKGTNSGACGSYAVDVYVIDNVAYAAVSSGGNKGVCDGKFIQYGDVVTPVAHTWDAKNVTYKGVKGADANIPVSIKCSKCGETFNVVAAGKIPADYLGDIDKDFFVGYWILLGNKSVPAVTNEVATKTTVSSAKTFDAGVAMYVGVALTGVAGSAVVIGKKKEF